jgi:regulatory protein YycI of two-component signal transduction system YycFG
MASSRKLTIVLLILIILFLIYQYYQLGCQNAKCENEKNKSSENMLVHWEDRNTPGVISGDISGYSAPLYLNELLYNKPMTSN